MATVTLTTINNSKNATSYYWDFGDATNSTLANPTHTYPYSGVYIIRLTATGLGGVATVEQPVAAQTGIPINFLSTDLLQQITDDIGDQLIV